MTLLEKEAFMEESKNRKKELRHLIIINVFACLFNLPVAVFHIYFKNFALVVVFTLLVLLNGFFLYNNIKHNNKLNQVMKFVESNKSNSEEENVDKSGN